MRSCCPPLKGGALCWPHLRKRSSLLSPADPAHVVSAHALSLPDNRGLPFPCGGRDWICASFAVVSVLGWRCLCGMMSLSEGATVGMRAQCCMMAPGHNGRLNGSPCGGLRREFQGTRWWGACSGERWGRRGSWGGSSTSDLRGLVWCCLAVPTQRPSGHSFSPLHGAVGPRERVPCVG